MEIMAVRVLAGLRRAFFTASFLKRDFSMAWNLMRD